MYIYDFEVDFFSGMSSTSTVMRPIQTAMLKFNGLSRKVHKHLVVTLNTFGGFHYHLESSIPIVQKNLLKSTQYFSKELSKDPMMISYVRPNRMMKR